MPRYLSKEKLEELKKELVKFKTAKRIEVAERLKRAKEFGDLSENSEYAEAREEQENVELRISELEEIIKNAVIFKKGKGRATVGIGSTVEVKKNNETKKFVIVGSDEARPEQGLISNESPLGAMLIGKKQGDVFSLTTRAGEIRYKIVRIE